MNLDAFMLPLRFQPSSKLEFSSPNRSKKREAGHKLLGVAKRVKEYRPSDYDLIYAYLSLFSEIVLLPDTVSEASNLLDQLKGERRERCMERSALLTKGSSERYVASAFAMEQPEYMVLGVADAAMLCALERGTYLLTADWELYLAALRRNCEAQHFQELRGWAVWNAAGRVSRA